MTLGLGRRIDSYDLKRAADEIVKGHTLRAVALAAGADPTSPKRTIQGIGRKLANHPHVLALTRDALERAKIGYGLSVERGIDIASVPVKVDAVRPCDQLEALDRFARITGAYKVDDRVPAVAVVIAFGSLGGHVEGE